MSSVIPQIYYSVKNQIFKSKILAILEANKTGEDIIWHFHDKIFDANNWFNEPFESLDELYALRAKQIREQYDYIVLLCSGGADSTNMLYSFIKNDIFPDEVMFSAPISGLSNYDYNNVDTSHRNTMSETKYAQLPLAQELCDNYPNIKVTLNDYFQNIIEYTDEKWIIDCSDWMHPSSASRYRFQKHKHLVQIAESGKSMAFVYGIDKPYIVISRDNSIYVGISDLAYNVMRSPFDCEYDNVENVMFYWDPKNIRCLTKQAHVVARSVLDESHPIYKYVYNVNSLPNTYEKHRFNQSKYERGIIPYIYKKLNRNVFQAEKPSKLFLGEHDEWFYKLHDKSIAFQMMTSETSNLLKSIKPKYLNKGLNGFAVHSRSFKIGHINQFRNMF